MGNFAPEDTAMLDPDILIRTLAEREEARKRKAYEEMQEVKYQDERRFYAAKSQERKEVSAPGYRMCAECEMPLGKCECPP